MAIDDNTTYGLTGAQVKDLAQRISAGGGPTVVQTTGTSTTDVMSQKAVTDTLFNNNNTTRIQIGSNASSTGGSYYSSVAIGRSARATGGSTVSIGSGLASGYHSIVLGEGQARNQGSIAIGYASDASGEGSIAIGGYSGSGNEAIADKKGSIAIGVGARVTASGEFNIGDRNATHGYSNSNYRLLTGLYDPQNAHDAATKGYVDPSTDTTAPTTSTAGRLGEIRIDTSTNTAYMCVSADSTTSTFIWKQITA